ncbi:MAG: hypothetical protein QM817_02730 [Archangium sp.]
MRLLVFVVALSGCATLTETRGDSPNRPLGEQRGGVVEYWRGARDDAYDRMTSHCGGPYEIVREAARVVGATGAAWSSTSQSALVSTDLNATLSKATTVGVTSSSVDTVNVIEFRCVAVRKQADVPAVSDDASRAEKLRADIRRKQADKDASARQERDPHGFRELRWGVARQPIEEAFPTAKIDASTGLLALLEPVAGLPASTLFGVSRDRLEFVVIRLQDRGAFATALQFLREKYGEPDLSSSEVTEWLFETTRIRLTRDPGGATVRYEDRAVQRRNDF